MPEGSPQGASASPLLANVHLHYVFDRWTSRWRKRHARGDMIVVRFADLFRHRQKSACAEDLIMPRSPMAGSV
jgi:retron-type reverse transcriptase